MSSAQTSSLSVPLDGWPGVVVGLSGSGHVVTSNGRLDALVGVSVVGRAVSELLDMESSGRKWERIATMAARDTGKIWELVFRDASRLHEARGFSAFPARGGDGAVIWLVEHPVDPRVVALNDQIAGINSELAMTQRSLVKEQMRLAAALKELERSNAALDEFAHVASHDLKAPLRAILDYADLIRSEHGDALGAEAGNYVERITVLGRKMRGMIDAILEYARAGRGGSTVAQVNTSLAIRELVEFLAPPADVTIVVDANLPALQLARVPFEQVFRNLISNAIKYRRAESAQVRVSAALEGAFWRFVVADNGPGIPSSQHDRIWRLFHTTRPEDGSGIGLALVKRLVEAQGGRVFVESVPGEGSRFSVLWPMARAS